MTDAGELLADIRKESNMATYTTKEGDQWDRIAKEVYGDEIYMDYLIENNTNYIDVFQFSAGTVLQVPDLPEDEKSDLPPWRR